MRPPRRPGEVVADIALFGPLVASAVLAALGHDTTSTCTRTTWRRWFLLYLAVHCAHSWRRDPLGRLDRMVRSTIGPSAPVTLHAMHRPSVSSLGRMCAVAVPRRPRRRVYPVKSGATERSTTP